MSPAELAALKDAHARATWIHEQLEVGDIETCAIALDDLAEDLWRLVEEEEHA